MGSRKYLPKTVMLYATLNDRKLKSTIHASLPVSIGQGLDIGFRHVSCFCLH